jgi:hypothetical protein
MFVGVAATVGGAMWRPVFARNGPTIERQLGLFKNVDLEITSRVMSYVLEFDETKNLQRLRFVCQKHAQALHRALCGQSNLQDLFFQVFVGFYEHDYCGVRFAFATRR